MCGIVGMIGEKSQKVDLGPSLKLLSQRGPDRQATLRAGQAHLGHTRLSIIDTSASGDQPMQDPSGRYTLVFNGEIYNYRTIADSLREQGVDFLGNSDTEVLLQLLIHRGEKAIHQLNGFFSFLFYDSRENTAILARDRIGIKPLYYRSTDTSLSFSSELKGLIPLLDETTIDPTAVSLYFRFNYIPHGASIFNDVQQLSPGHFMKWSAGKSEIIKYYEIAAVDAAESLSELLEDAVKIRLVSDVPLGSFLSGGVDSSIIAALAAKQKPGLKTFSIGFKDNSYFDESAYAEKVAAHIGTDHQTIQLSEDEMLAHVEGLLEYIDEPFADSSAIAVHALSQHTRKEVTVALSGDGADELFGGYNKHQAHLAALNPDTKESLAALAGKLSGGIKGGHGSRIGNILRQSQRFSAGMRLNAPDRYWAWASWTQPKVLDKLLAVDKGERYESILRELGPRNESIEEVLMADSRCVLPCDMLTKVDRMSMANSLEVRVPFLDHRVVDHAHRLRAADRFSKGQGKAILRREFSYLLPEEIFTRKKKGFEVPLEKWFNGPLEQSLINCLDDGMLVSTGFFKGEYLDRLKKEVQKGKVGDKVHLLWALMVFHRFYSRYGHC